MSLSTNALPRGAIRIRNANLSFASDATGTDILQNISLDVSPGEFVAILGASGCGKSTLLGAIAGFTRLTRGEIFVDSKLVQKPAADRGIVFQDHNLFPWKTVISNVEFGLKMRGVVKAERREIAKEILARIGLSEFWRHYPRELSGGMQQRVNLARVLVNRPEVLLMDEPFGALDAQTRLQMQEMLLGLWEEYGMTVVFVTHDIDEAILLSDRVLIMSRRPGRIAAEIPVSLGRPRTFELSTSADFQRIKRQCLDYVHPDSSRSAVGQNNGRANSALNRNEAFACNEAQRLQ
jgi:NitT/TauT family transport system ATP-binding protein